MYEFDVMFLFAGRLEFSRQCLGDLVGESLKACLHRAFAFASPIDTNDR